MNLSPKQFGSVASSEGVKWTDLTHKDAHAKAESFQNSWMAGPAHRDSYQHHVWHPDTLQGGAPKMHTYDSVRPSVEKGVAGIVTRRGAFHDFIPNENISAMSHSEREGADPSHVREDNHRKSRLASGYDD